MYTAKYSRVSDFYSYPSPSKNVQVMLGKGFGKSLVFKIEDILHKCYLSLCVPAGAPLS